MSRRGAEVCKVQLMELNELRRYRERMYAALTTVRRQELTAMAVEPVAWAVHRLRCDHDH